MLAAFNRLKKKSDFDRVFTAGSAVYGRHIGIKAAGNDLKCCRIGIIVSSKVSKKASARNLIKRRIRAVIRDRIKDMVTGKDLVIIALPPAAADYEGLRDEICLLLKKGRLIK